MAGGGVVVPIFAREVGVISQKEPSMETVVCFRGVKRMCSEVSEQSARWSCAPVSMVSVESAVVMVGWPSRRGRKVGRFCGFRARWMGGGEVTFCERSQEVRRESAGVGGESLWESVMAAWPLEMDFCQSPWRRMAQESSGRGVEGWRVGFFPEGDGCEGWGVVDFSVEELVAGWGLMRWSPAAMAWEQRRPSRRLAGQGQVASSQVAVRAATVAR